MRDSGGGNLALALSGIARSRRAGPTSSAGARASYYRNRKISRIISWRVARWRLSWRPYQSGGRRGAGRRVCSRRLFWARRQASANVERRKPPAGGIGDAPRAISAESKSYPIIWAIAKIVRRGEMKVKPAACAKSSRRGKNYRKAFCGASRECEQLCSIVRVAQRAVRRHGIKPAITRRNSIKRGNAIKSRHPACWAKW